VQRRAGTIAGGGSGAPPSLHTPARAPPCLAAWSNAAAAARVAFELRSAEAQENAGMDGRGGSAAPLPRAAHASAAHPGGRPSSSGQAPCPRTSGTDPAASNRRHLSGTRRCQRSPVAGSDQITCHTKPCYLLLAPPPPFRGAAS
jgi:hypothetical protein